MRTESSAVPWATASSGPPSSKSGPTRSRLRPRPSAVMKAMRTSAAPTIHEGMDRLISASAPPSAALWARLSIDSSRVDCICMRTVRKAATAMKATDSPTTMVVSNDTRLASDRR